MSKKDEEKIEETKDKKELKDLTIHEYHKMIRDPNFLKICKEFGLDEKEEDVKEFVKRAKKVNIDKIIKSLEIRINEMDPVADKEMYQELQATLAKFATIKTQIEHNSGDKWKFAGTVVTTISGLFLGLCILKYEDKNALVTKALSILTKFIKV